MCTYNASEIFQSQPHFHVMCVFHIGHVVRLGHIINLPLHRFKSNKRSQKYEKNNDFPYRKRTIPTTKKNHDNNIIKMIPNGMLLKIAHHFVSIKKLKEVPFLSIVYFKNTV